MYSRSKIQQTKMLDMCQRFGDLFLFWLIKYNKGRFKVMATCSSNITLNLPSYTGSALKRELNFCNGYLSLLHFWYYSINYLNPMCACFGFCIYRQVCVMCNCVKGKVHVILILYFTNIMKRPKAAFCAKPLLYIKVELELASSAFN